MVLWDLIMWNGDSTSPSEAHTYSVALVFLPIRHLRCQVHLQATSSMIWYSFVKEPQAMRHSKWPKSTVGGGGGCSFNIREKSVYTFVFMETQGHANISVDLVNAIRLGSRIFSCQGLWASVQWHWTMPFLVGSVLWIKGPSKTSVASRQQILEDPFPKSWRRKTSDVQSACCPEESTLTESCLRAKDQSVCSRSLPFFARVDGTSSSRGREKTNFSVWLVNKHDGTHTLLVYWHLPVSHLWNLLI